MRELEANDEVETGATIRVSYDGGKTFEGEVVAHDKRSMGDRTDLVDADGEEYVLFHPMASFDDFDLQQGGHIDGSSRSTVTKSPDSVEVLGE